MRAPCDLEDWQKVEEKWHDFQNEPCHLKLGLVANGVNPFSNQNTNYSLWPMCIVNHNIPPWMTTKKTFIFFALIVLGKSQVKNMDVYLQPLVEELKMLQEEGMKVVDAPKSPLEEFQV